MTLHKGTELEAAIGLVQLCKLQSSLAQGLHRNTICCCLCVIPVSMGLETVRGVVTMFIQRNTPDCLFCVEYFAHDLTTEGEERCPRCTVMCVEDGFIHRVGAQSTILVTDGFGSCTSAHTCTGMQGSRGLYPRHECPESLLQVESERVN